MIKVILTFIVLLTLDNLLVIFLPLQPIASQYTIVPNLFLIGLCFFCFFDQKNIALILAAIFGLIYDIYFTNLIGIHVALFPAIIVVLKRYIVPITPVNFISIGAVSGVSVMVKELVLYLLFTTFSYQVMPLLAFIQYRLFITTIFNLIILLLIYFPLMRIFKSYVEKS